MKAHSRKLSFIVSCFVACCVMADDTEVFVDATTATPAAPNVLLVFDTSPSMLANFDTIYTTFDPSQTYSGDCDANVVYWSVSQDHPVQCDSTQRFNLSNFYCKHVLDELNEDGEILDVVVRGWNAGYSSGPRWSPLGSWGGWTDADTPVDCEADAGIHGEADGDGATYMTKFSTSQGGGGMWTSNASNQFDWDEYGGSVRRFWSANYSNWYHYHREIDRDRLTVLKTVVDDLLVDLSSSTTPMNVGILQFAKHDGGRIIAPVGDIDDNLDNLRDVVQDLQITCATPLTEAVYESYLYLTGGTVEYGGTAITGCEDDEVPEVLTPSVPASVEGGNAAASPAPDYISPIELSCQKNYVIVLSDGEPTNDGSADNEVEDLLEPTSLADRSCDADDDDFCLDELAQYMNEIGVLVDRPVTADFETTIQTYTIGFGVDHQLLQDAATKGGGTYYTAFSADELAAAFEDALDIVLDINTTFTAPGVAVNAYNRQAHLDQLYFSVFKPEDKPDWSGNLKRFKLGRDGDGAVAILDRNGANAVDVFTGFFKETATSWWTGTEQAPDGGNPDLGGAAEQLTTSRKVYTRPPGSTVDDLTASGNALNTANVTAAMLGMSGSELFTVADVINHALGKQWNGSSFVSTQHISDPLHSVPTLVLYTNDQDGDGDSDEDGDGADDDFELVIFFGTNDGKLMAIDGQTGEERFSYIPESLLPNLVTAYRNTTGGDKLYGIDGPVTPWLKDTDDDGLVEPADGDRVYLYFTLRRGGREVHALDVTDPDSPKYLWSIAGGSGEFEELGQTWSAPRIARVNVGGTPQDVLIFGGGYDEAQDGGAGYAGDGMGRAVYMIDPLTGDVIWWAGHSDNLGADLRLNDMDNAIPSAIAVLDVDGDTLADRMYAGDMGGRVWRFDIHNGRPVDSLVTGAAIAQLGAAHLDEPESATASNRRFFERPDVSVTVDSVSGNSWMNIALGSGYRASPRNDEVEDHFYVVRDHNPYALISDYSSYSIDVADLVDITDTVEPVIPAGSPGWYLRLVDAGGSMLGEKVLSRATTVDGNVLFTTFTPIPPPSGSGACGVAAGYNRAYVISVRNGSPVLDLDEDGASELTTDDRAQGLDSAGIAPGVVVLFTDDGEAAVFSGPERVQVPEFELVGRTYWHKEAK